MCITELPRDSKDSLPKLARGLLLSLTPTRWRPVKMTALSKGVRLIVQSSMPKESQLENLPTHHTRRKGEIKDAGLEVGNLILETPRNWTLQPIGAKPYSDRKPGFHTETALFVGPNISCRDAANFEQFQKRKDSQWWRSSNSVTIVWVQVTESPLANLVQAYSVE